MMELRPYQVEAIERLSAGFREGHLRQILVMPTGSGKTATAGEMIQRATQKGNRSLFVVERIELAHQAVRHLESLGLSVGLMQGANTSFNDDDSVIVASIQTLASRGIPDGVRLIVQDEAHILHKAHIRLMEKYNAVPVIGLTATPLRRGLGKVFSRLVKGPLIRDLVRDDFLVPVKAYGPAQDRIERVLEGVAVSYQPGGKDYVTGELSKALNRKELVGDLIATWKAKAAGLPTLVFAVDIAHSKAIVDDFLADGVFAEHLDAYTDAEERRQIIERFRSGETTVLSSVNVLAIGFDVPIARCGILARPTLSLTMHVQQVGRVMRPAPGKDHALILDHAANFARHGKPEDFDVEVLDDGEITPKSNGRKTSGLKPCPTCGLLLEPDRRECPGCGYERHRANTVHYLDGDLHEIGGGDRIGGGIDPCTFYRQLRQVGRDRGWSRKAPAAQYKTRYGSWPPHQWEGLSPLTPAPETLRWVQSRMIAYAKARQRQAAA